MSYYALSRHLIAVPLAEPASASSCTSSNAPLVPWLLALPCRERDKLALQQRIARLTQCILHGAAAATQMERRLRAPPSEQAAAAATAQASSLSLGLGAEASAGSRGTAPPPLADVATTVAGVRGAGALFPGSELERASTARCEL